MKPTIGRIVLWRSKLSGLVYPAIVVLVEEGPQYTTINLEVFGQHGEKHGYEIREAESSTSPGTPAPGFWCWPPRVG